MRKSSREVKELIFSDGKRLTGDAVRSFLARRYYARRDFEDRVYRSYLEGNTVPQLCERFNISKSYAYAIINAKGGAIAPRNAAQLEVLTLKKIGDMLLDFEMAWEHYQRTLMQIEQSDAEWFAIEQTDGTGRDATGVTTKKISRNEAISRVHKEIANLHSHFFNNLKSILPRHTVLHVADDLENKSTEELDKELEVLESLVAVKRKKKDAPDTPVFEVRPAGA